MYGAVVVVGATVVVEAAVVVGAADVGGVVESLTVEVALDVRIVGDGVEIVALEDEQPTANAALAERRIRSLRMPRPYGRGDPNMPRRT
jgi:hypothetical protein